MSVWPNFICEVCTVRSQLGRELHGRHDWRLLCFERQRMIDIAHRWSPGTHKQYQSKLRALQRFENLYGLSVLSSTPLRAPPKSPAIPLQWAQLEYSLRPSTVRKEDHEVHTVRFGSVRPLRSAASQFAAMDWATSRPVDTIYDRRSDQLFQQPCRFTDSVTNQLFAAGLSTRMGTDSKPSIALLDRHIRYIEEDLDRRWRAATSPKLKEELAEAGFSTLTFWLGWVRSAECFGIRFSDIRVTEPEHYASLDLPPGVGCARISLRPETKTMRDHRADLVIAYETVSGYCYGKWFHRVREARELGNDWVLDNNLVFTQANGKPWTSKYYRTTYLYPALHKMRAEGDAYLRPYDGTPGNSLEEKFWSLHSFRRGANSHVSRRQPNTVRKADDSEKYAHARWRKHRQNEKIDKQYEEWPISARVNITLCCQ